MDIGMFPQIYFEMVLGQLLQHLPMIGIPIFVPNIRTGMGTPLCPRSGKDSREENEVGTKNVTAYGQEI